MLNIYKASAGSGKTFTLALIYIDLIIDDFNKYSHILAVTFTNKSTAEMKSRIIKNLYTISNPAAKGHAQLLEAQKKYRAEHGKSEVNDIEIIKSCQNALVLLLNNYSQFNIYTIDKFVQKIIRSFAFENRLSADYKVNIDTDQTKVEMVDRLMANMESDYDLQNWLTRLMNEKMEEGNGWNIEGKLLPIADSLLNGHELKSVDRNELEESRKRNRERLKELYKTIVESLEELKRFFVNNSIQKEDLCNKSKNPVWSALNKVNENKNIEALLKDTKTLSDIAKYIYKAYTNGGNLKKGDNDTLQSILERANQAFETGLTEIVTISLLDTKFYSLGIINDMKQNLSEIEHEQHMQMIGGANKLLKDLIGNAPIPFIYEKAGSRFDNIMIDEFQDTSKMQWDNFKPLIENCLDSNNQCLLVGDVKQAIYRWRNSDWKLLSETVYNDKQLEQFIEDNTLGVNWRSCRNVIEFNNDIFPALVQSSISYILSKLNDDEASAKILNKIGDIYSSGIQKVSTTPKSTDGYVQISIIPHSNAASAYKNQQMLDTIKRLVEQGYKYSDICILIRNNSEATEIVQFLNSEGINVLSNQALYVCASQSIKAILSILSLVVSDDDEPSLAHVLAFMNSTSVEQLYEAWRGALRDEMIQKIKHLRGLGLLELVYQTIDMLPKEARERDYIFLEAFIEKARSFVDGQAASPKEFIEYIEAHQSSFVIQAPEGQNAVNITSIHKSKGLEYPIVLIPNADWRFFRNGDQMWCDLSEDDLSPLNTMELPFSQIKDTIYNDQYYNEATQTVVDNMNLLYVAFTRAKDGLFVWSKLGDRNVNNISSVRISNLLELVFNEESSERFTNLDVNKEIVEIEGDDDETVSFEVSKYSRGDINALLMTHSEEKEDGKEELPTVSFDGDITKRINQTKDEIEEESDKTELGTAKHNIMQDIERVEDLEKSIKRALVNGDIKEEEARELTLWFTNGQKDDTIRSWFDGTQRVINESIILCASNKKEYRTDRVMISENGEVTVVDYKFAQKDKKHIEQVKRYMTLVRQAGYAEVKGYLWYGSEEKPVSVTF